MRGLTLTPITLVLVILLRTSSFPNQAQSRERTITKAQIEEIVKNFKIRPGSGGEAPEGHKLERLVNCTQLNRGCDGVRKSLVIKELLLRLQIREMGEACTSDGIYSTVLYTTPYRGYGPVPDAYEKWQDEILGLGRTFCDPFKHLSCSSISKKCECRPGTVWNPQFACSAVLGGYCWIPGHKPPDKSDDFVSFYDPLSFDFRGKESIFETECRIFDSSCKPNLKLFLNYTCADTKVNELDEKLGNQFKDLPRLNFGDSCNLEHQTQLFTTTEEEIKNYTIRVKNLEAILAAKTPFCDLKLLLMCGSGGKCECINPTNYNPETKSCTFKSADATCQGQTTFEEMTTRFPGSVEKEVMEGFESVRDLNCPYKCAEASFADGYPVVPSFRFCRPCPESNRVIQKVGKKCDKDLTLFLEGAPPPSLPIDIPDYDKQLELFVQFNEKAKEFEKLFRLEKNSPCDYEGELDASRSIRRIKNVEVPDKIFTEQNYKDLMNSMDKLIGQFRGRGLCRYRLRGQPGSSDSPPLNLPLLLCGPTSANAICFEPNNTFYLEVLMKRLAGKSTSQVCAPHPKDILKYTENSFRNLDSKIKDLSGMAYEYLFNTLENLWIDNSQFCNRAGGFKCSKPVPLYGRYDKINATGVCEFSKAYLEEVQADAEAERLAKLALNSKSSHDSIQHFFPTLLFVLHIIILN